MTRVFLTDVDICNDAIARVGGKLIQSIESPTTLTENYCATMYPKNRRIVLRSAVWNFARTTKEIAKSSEQAKGYAGVYPLPNDFLRLLGVIGMDLMGYDTDRYRLSDNKLYLVDCGTPSIELEYIRDVEDATRFDPLFTEALSLRLAYNLQYALSGKNTTAQRLYEEYQLALAEAKSIDGQEQKPIRVQRSRWLAARRRGTVRSYASKTRYFED